MRHTIRAPARTETRGRPKQLEAISKVERSMPCVCALEAVGSGLVGPHQDWRAEKYLISANCGPSPRPVLK